jgi:hypothetical protein
MRNAGLSPATVATTSRGRTDGIVSNFRRRCDLARRVGHENIYQYLSWHFPAGRTRGVEPSELNRPFTMEENRLIQGKATLNIPCCFVDRTRASVKSQAKVLQQQERNRAFPRGKETARVPEERMKAPLTATPRWTRSSEVSKSLPKLTVLHRPVISPLRCSQNRAFG